MLQKHCGCDEDFLTNIMSNSPSTTAGGAVSQLNTWQHKPYQSRLNHSRILLYRDALQVVVKNHTNQSICKTCFNC